MNPVRLTKSSKDGSGDGMSYANTRRLMAELEEITKNPPALCSARLKGDDLHEWEATIKGPPDSVYEGGVFKLSMTFPQNYPFSPPHVLFKTRIHHVNISASGDICLDILNIKWSAAMRVSSLLVSICALMTDRSRGTDFSRLSAGAKVEHDRMAREYTRRYASK